MWKNSIGGSPPSGMWLRILGRTGHKSFQLAFQLDLRDCITSDNSSSSKGSVRKSMSGGTTES